MSIETAWQNAVKTVSPYVVKISTPNGSGTGFLIFRSVSGEICGIATAAHVVDHAHEWGQPIRLRHFDSGKTQLLTDTDRSVYIDQQSDSAVIIFHPREDVGFPFPEQQLALWQKGHYLKVGNEVGWTGFPSVSPEDFCFFSGRVSCYIKDLKAYLIDGVAINGVSGGPAFFPYDGDNGEEFLSLIGIISAYIPNVSTKDVLPGVALVRDVSKLHDWVAQFHTLDEAKEAEPAPSQLPANEPPS